MTQPRTIAVLGGGYAGLFAAQRAASGARGPAVRVVLIDAGDAWQDRTRWHVTFIVRWRGTFDAIWPGHPDARLGLLDGSS